MKRGSLLGLAAGTLALFACRSATAPRVSPAAVPAPPASGAPDAVSTDATPPEQPPWPPGEGLAAPSNAGTYWVSVVPSPDAIPFNESFDLAVRVLDSARTRVPADIDVRIDARMPEHGHGMNHDPRVRRAADGSWEVSGMLLHMIGRWEIHVDVLNGPLIERAQFDLELE